MKKDRLICIGTGATDTHIILTKKLEDRLNRLDYRILERDNFVFDCEDLYKRFLKEIKLEIGRGDRRPAGSVFNVAANYTHILSPKSTSVDFICALGGDRDSQIFLEKLEERPSMSFSGERFSEGIMKQVYVFIDLKKDGERKFAEYSGVSGDLTSQSLLNNLEKVQQATKVHTNVYSLATCGSLSRAVSNFTRAAKHDGAFMSLNLSSPSAMYEVFGDKNKRNLFLEILKFQDLIMGDDRESEYLLGCFQNWNIERPLVTDKRLEPFEVRDVLLKLRGYLPDVTFVTTMGANGCAGLDKGVVLPVFRSCEKVLNPVNTTGAGDAGHAAVLRLYDVLPFEEVLDNANFTAQKLLKSPCTIIGDIPDYFFTLATIDYLTNLPGRRGLMVNLEKEMIRAKNFSENPLTFIMCDIDYFKQVNDNYSHETGDTVLKIVASLLNANLRPSDYVGRMGGEEFGVILPNTKVEDAVSVVQRFREDIFIETSFALAAEKLQNGKEPMDAITLSYGITQFSGESIDDFIRAADLALYEAKEVRDTYVFAK